MNNQQAEYASSHGRQPPARLNLVLSGEEQMDVALLEHDYRWELAIETDVGATAILRVHWSGNEYLVADADAEQQVITYQPDAQWEHELAFYQEQEECIPDEVRADDPDFLPRWQRTHRPMREATPEVRAAWTTLEKRLDTLREVIQLNTVRRVAEL